MTRTRSLAVLLLVATGSAIAIARAASTAEQGAPPGAPTAASSPPPPPDDPAVLRGKLLARLDAAIDAAATRAHLEARLTVDELMPVPYLGVDGTPVDGGMKIDRVYPDTGAEASGLSVGDVLTQLDEDRTDSKTALARAVRRHRVGQDAALRVLREGKTLTLRARIGRRPEEDEDEVEQFPDLPQTPALAPKLRFDFEADEPSTLPPALTGVLGGHGAPGRWIVVREGPLRFLRQEDGDTTGIRFPMVVAAGIDAPDVVGRARFRYSGGKSDRAAGVVLRYRDPGNYLVARTNAAEADLRIFRVVNGLRQTLPGGVVPCPTDDDRWHTIEFRCEGPRLTATVDGGTKASSFDTFFRRGAAGLWTKSDSRTDFDDVTFEPIEAPPGGEGAPK